MSTFLRRYFGLGMLEAPVMLGPAKPTRVPVKGVLMLVVMYLGVLLGVIANYVLEASRDSGGDAIHLTFVGLLKGWLVAMLLFPLVYPRIFNMTAPTSGTTDDAEVTLMNRSLRFFVAFENGFFWQAVLM